jgi:hypothetical protein
MPQARWPACTSLCRIALDTRVLPISVSVPVTKQAKRVGMPSAASAAGTTVQAVERFGGTRGGRRALPVPRDR